MFPRLHHPIWSEYPNGISGTSSIWAYTKSWDSSCWRLRGVWLVICRDFQMRCYDQWCHDNDINKVPWTLKWWNSTVWGKTSERDSSNTAIQDRILCAVSAPAVLFLNGKNLGHPACLQGLLCYAHEPNAGNGGRDPVECNSNGTNISCHMSHLISKQKGFWLLDACYWSLVSWCCWLTVVHGCCRCCFRHLLQSVLLLRCFQLATLSEQLLNWSWTVHLREIPFPAKVRTKSCRHRSCQQLRQAWNMSASLYMRKRFWVVGFLRVKWV